MNEQGRPSRWRRAARRASWAVAALLVGVLVAAGVAEYKGWAFLRAPLSQTVSDRLGRQVALTGPFHLQLRGPITLSVGQLVVAQPAWRADAPGPMLTLVDLQAALSWREAWAVLMGQPWQQMRLDHVGARSLALDLWRDAQGRANWSLTPDGTLQAEGSGDRSVLPRVDRLVVRQAGLQWRDAVWDLVLDARANTREGDGAGESGPGQPQPGLQASGEGRYQGHPFTVRLSSSGLLPLVDRQQPQEAVPISVTAQLGGGRLSFDGTSEDVLQLDGLDGRVDVRGQSMARLGEVMGVTLPTTAPFVLQGRLRKSGDRWALRDSMLNVGDSQLGGWFEVDKPPGAVPLLRGELTGSRLAIKDLAPSFGAPPPGSPSAPRERARLMPERELDVPSLRAMDASVRVRLARVSLGHWFERPLAPLHADLRLKQGVLTLDQIQASTADGTLAGRIVLDGREPTLGWDARLQWRGIRLERWLQADNPRARAPDASYVSGLLSGRGDLAGKGNSVAQLMGSLDGQVITWVDQGQLSRLVTEVAGLHLLEALGLLIQGDEPAPLRCGVARFEVRKGVMTPQPVVVDTGRSTILVSGQVSLVDEKLALTVTSTPRHFTLISLRTPIDIGGTLSAPAVRLRPAPMGVRALSALALGAVAPLAALLPLIDTGGDQPGCQALLKAKS